MFNRQSVQGAIRSTQQRLKLYQNKHPQNGLIVFCGLATTDTGEASSKGERQVTIDLEPLQPIGSFIYRCNNHFHVEPLKKLVIDENEKRYGFIIVNGHGTLFGVLQGNNTSILQEFQVDLPNKHRRGGQSARRFQRLCDEKRRNYLRKVANLAANHFLKDNRPTVAGMVVAGEADCKDELVKSNVFSKVLRSIIVGTFTIPHGRERGFHLAIEQSAEAIGATQTLQEKQILGQFLQEIDQDTGKYCFAIKDTLQALEMGAVETLIVWEDLDVTRCVHRNLETDELYVVYEKSLKKNGDMTIGDEKNEVVEKDSLVDWLCENFRRFGCKVSIVSSRTSVGTQFASGFGGIGGILRWKIDFVDLRGYDDCDSNESSA